MRWWGWIILALVVWWIVANPHQAAGDVHSVTTFASDLVHGNG